MLYLLCVSYFLPRSLSKKIQKIEIYIHGLTTILAKDIFLYGIIVPVIPFALTARIDVPEGDVQHWVSVLLAVYGAALLACSPICGHLADHTASRRLPLLIGLLALAGSTLLLCLGKTIAMLVAGRILQGISAAVVWTVGLALLADTVGHETIGQSMGYVTMSMSVAVLVAPLLGGVVYARAGYYAVFFMAFGLIALDIILRILLVEKKIAKRWDSELSSPTAVEKLPASTSHPLDDTAVPELSTPPVLSPAPSDEQLPPAKVSIFPAEKHTVAKQKHPLLLLLTSRRLISALFCTLCRK